MTVHVGTSGWSYAHWTGVLYPEGLLPRERLGYCLPHFRATELNASYYRWPSDAAFRAWRRRLPERFVLSVKAPGLLTHVQRLYAPERWLPRIDRAMRLLGPRAGPLLEQLSPTFELDYARLAWFLGHVPAGRRVAVELRLRAHARPRPAPPLRLIVFRCGPALVGHRIREWGQQGRDVYVYFNNDGEGNAVRNAATLRRILGDA